MKWCAIISLVLAILVKFAWKGSTELSYRFDATTHRVIPLGSVIFWVLLAIAMASSLFLLIRRLS